MAVRKFRFTLADTPSSIQQDDEGDTVVKVRFPTKSGQKVLVLRDQEVVKTESDPVADHALENYHPPRIPMKHHPGGVPTHAFHDYDDHSANRPFTEIANTAPYDHVL